jgi:polar amino acid transport system permease protein
MDELLRRTEMLIQEQFRVLEIFTVAAFYYLVLTTLWGFVQQWIERRLALGQPGAGSAGKPAAVAAVQAAALSHDAV